MLSLLLQWFRTRRVKREQARRERLGMAARPKLNTRYLKFHMIDVNPDRTLTR